MREMVKADLLHEGKDYIFLYVPEVCSHFPQPLIFPLQTIYPPNPTSISIGKISSWESENTQGDELYVATRVDR